MMSQSFESMLTGGHPNSLGRTVEVVELVLERPSRFDELFHCYFSDDEVVRLRTSNALKRVEAENHGLLVPYIDRFIEEIAKINQASTQWTLAQLFERLAGDMSEAQVCAATEIIKRNLLQSSDWIVLKTSMDTLAAWAQSNETLKDWLVPHLVLLQQDERKSVSSRAGKYHRKFTS